MTKASARQVSGRAEMRLRPRFVWRCSAARADRSRPKIDTVSGVKLGAAAGTLPPWRRRPTASVTRYFTTGRKLATRSAALNIAMGENAVKNPARHAGPPRLRDIRWKATGRRNFSAAREEIVCLPLRGLSKMKSGRASCRVLTSEQQDALRQLIRDWVEKNPDQAYVWAVRFTGLSGQRAEELERVAATGGLLAEAQRSRETVDAGASASRAHDVLPAARADSRALSG
jgi:hypothetical protein